jgi:8-oxo-dGTP diphosphatase
MRNATICLLVRGDEILLAMKKRGFGVGKWNGVGGKVSEGETIESAALREMEEEINGKSHERHLEKIASIKFYFKDKSKDWDQHVHVFLVKDWEGEPRESEEMKPQWYKHHEIPFDQMWVDDKYWLPLVLEGKKLEGELHFNDDGNEFDEFDLREI